MRHWRKMTWTIWGWTILCAIWIATGLGAHEGNCNGLSASACSAAGDVGHGIAVVVQFIVWLLVFLVLSVIWFMTRSRGRTCPQCGEDVRKGKTKCGKCGYDYAANLPAGGAAPG